MKDDFLVPPPALGSDRVILYAVVDKSVVYTGKQRLFVGDKLLKKVPKIAICKSLKKGAQGYLILFCNDKWDACGVTQAQSLAKAKREAERCYAGITEKFIAAKNSVKDTRLWLAKEHVEDTCSFCGRLYFESTTMVHAKSGAVICSACIRDFAGRLGADVED